MQHKYSYRFGNEAVGRFLKQHARATEFVRQMLGMSPGNFQFYLAEYVTSDDQRPWNLLKGVIKRLDNHNWDDYAHWDEDKRRNYLTYVRQLVIISETYPIKGRNGIDTTFSMTVN